MLKLSLKIKMTLVVFILVSAVIAAVTGLGFFFFAREYKATVATRQFSVVSAIAYDLDDKITATQGELVAVARSITPDILADPRKMDRFLDSRLDLLQAFGDGTGYFSTDGTLRAFSPGQNTFVGRNFSQQDFCKKTVQTGKPYISQPFRTVIGEGHPIVVFTAPVFDRQGHMAGFLAGRIDLLEENFLGRLARLKVGEGGNFFIFNKQRQLVVHRNQDRLLQGEVRKGNALVERALAGFEGSGETVSHTGESVLCSFKKLKATDWILGARLPMSEAYANIDRVGSLLLWCLGLALPAGLLTVWLFVGKLIEPLLLLTRRVGEAGKQSATFRPIAVGSGDEIAVLAAAFNKVMSELASQRSLLEKEKRLAEQLLQHTAVACFVTDDQHRVIIWNRACEELTGFPAEEVLGKSEPWRAFYDSPRRVLADIVVDGTLHEMADQYVSYADSPLVPEGLRAEGWYRLKGKEKFLSFDAAPIRDIDGRIVAAIQTLQDVTLRESTEKQLRKMVSAIGESEERFRRLVELSLDGIAILVERRFVFVNPAGCEMLGFMSAEDLLGREMLGFIQRESEEMFVEQLGYAERSGSNSPWIEERLLRRDGTTMEVELGVSRFVYKGKAALQVIFRDITERKLAKARLETLAHYDALTTLPNRVLFFDRLQHAVSEAKRYQHPLALMFLDLDRFKQINDTLGHAAGDIVLVEAGRRLKECIRACDMVARMGGDEFTIILSKMADELDASLVAERIIQALSLPFEIEGNIATIGVSIGICIYPTYGDDLDGMVRQADLALYRAKEAGRNGYCFYTSEPKRAVGE